MISRTKPNHGMPRQEETDDRNVDCVMTERLQNCPARNHGNVVADYLTNTSTTLLVAESTVENAGTSAPWACSLDDVTGKSRGEVTGSRNVRRVLSRSP